MELYEILLITHIICGSAGLLLGTYVLFAKKGNRKHKLIGTIFFYALLIASVVSLDLARIHPNYFLFIIGIFTIYMLLTGKRYLAKQKDPEVTVLDKALSIIMFLFALAFVALGMYNIIKGNFFGIVFLVFGGSSLLFVYQDYQNFSGKSKIKNYGLVTHIQRMVGSYIASLTAFVVVNNTVLPGIIAWLLPSLVVVPFIIKWGRQYKTAKL